MDFSTVLGAAVGTFLAQLLVGANLREDVRLLRAFCVDLAEQLHIKAPAEPRGSRKG